MWVSKTGPYATYAGRAASATSSCASVCVETPTRRSGVMPADALTSACPSGRRGRCRTPRAARSPADRSRRGGPPLCGRGARGRGGAPGSRAIPTPWTGAATRPGGPRAGPRRTPPGRGRGSPASPHRRWRTGLAYCEPHVPEGQHPSQRVFVTPERATVVARSMRGRSSGGAGSSTTTSPRAAPAHAPFAGGEASLLESQRHPRPRNDAGPCRTGARRTETPRACPCSGIGPDTMRRQDASCRAGTASESRRPSRRRTR